MKAKPAHEYNRNTNLVAKGPDVPPTPGLERVKTDGRIGSATHPNGGWTVDNNRKAGPPAEIGTQAARHMSPSHGGEHWSPRVAKARKAAATPRRRTGLK
jgi:hypothetical protein